MEKDIGISTLSLATLSLACENLNAEEMGRLLQAIITYCYAKEDEEDDKDEIVEESLIGNERYVWPIVREML